LKKISVTGGTAVTLADAPTSRRGSWGEDGNIVFHANAQAGLLRVSSAGGKAEPLTKVGGGGGHTPMAAGVARDESRALHVEPDWK